MATRTHTGHWAYWRGQGARRTWSGCRRGERCLTSALTARGWPAGLARGLLWGVKLVLLAVLLYAAFRLALVLALVWGGLWLAANTDPEDCVLEWREGEDGTGLYDKWGNLLSTGVTTLGRLR